MNKVLIKEVQKDSIAEEVGIEIGDFLLSINDSEIHDIIEYKYLITDEELLLKIEKDNKEIWEIEIEKDYDEDLGIVFENATIEPAKGCQNNCIFCFIDQLPKGLRSSLYFKDDDTRLSFLQGNYVTLTNMKEEEIERIIKYRIHPINISVHTTNPELRKRMLNNKHAGDIKGAISRFSNAQLTMNTQIVLCPNVNDGIELENTLKDLSKFYPWVKSVTIVPVGISKHRMGLYPLREFNRDEAQRVLSQITDLQKTMLKKHNTRFVFPGDEFIIKAQEDFPDVEYYEGFEQLENGVGMSTLFKKQLLDALENTKESIDAKSISVVTGKLAYPFMKDLMSKLMTKWDNLNIKVYGIKNEFLGEKITVSGLIAGQDIINQLKGKDLGEAIFIPQSMLKEEDNVFLDDLTVEDVSMGLCTKVYPTQVDGQVLINKILNMNSLEEF